MRVVSRPLASMADSASSRRRRMRCDSRVAKASSTAAATANAASVTTQQALERAAAHRQDGVGGLLDHHRAEHLVAVPDRIRGRHHHGAAVGRVAHARAGRALQRAGDVASGGEHVRGDGLVEILGRALDQPAEQLLPQARAAAAASGRLQAAREREHAVVAVDHPDARRGALEARENGGDLGDLLARRRLARDFARRSRAAAIAPPASGAGVSPRAAASRCSSASASLRNSESIAGCRRISCGRPCSAVATARAVAICACSCPSSRKRSISLT